MFLNLIVTGKIDRTNHTRTASDRCVSKDEIPSDAPISMRTDKGRICSIFHPRATCCVTATGFRSGRLIGLVTHLLCSCNDRGRIYRNVCISMVCQTCAISERVYADPFCDHTLLGTGRIGILVCLRLCRKLICLTSSPPTNKLTVMNQFVGFQTVALRKSGGAQIALVWFLAGMDA